MKRLYLQRLGSSNKSLAMALVCVLAAFAGFLLGGYAEDKPTVDKQSDESSGTVARMVDQLQTPAFDQPQVKSAGEYYFPNWVFDDPKGDNALVTTVQLESSDEPLYKYTNYFKRFSPSYSKYSGKKTIMRVARTQAEFDDILKTMAGPAVVPRKLNFDKELFVFIFNGTQDANEYTVVEVGEVDRNNGPIKLGDKSFTHHKTGDLVTMHDEVIVRAEVQIGKPGIVSVGFSPWTMIRVNKETFFKQHPMNDETHFTLIESRSYIYTKIEQ